MKKIIFVILLSIFLVACKKHEEIPENPAWLNEIIAQMETYNHPGIIYLYKWHWDYYYWIQDPLSSYYNYQIYNYNGELSNEQDEIIHNGKMIKIVWRRVYTTYTSE